MIEVMPGYVLVEPIETEKSGVFVVTEGNIEKQLKVKWSVLVNKVS